MGDPQPSIYETEHFNKIIQFVGEKGRIMGFHLKQTNRDLIFVQDEVRSFEADYADAGSVVGGGGEGELIQAGFSF